MKTPTRAIVILRTDLTNHGHVEVELAPGDYDHICIIESNGVTETACPLLHIVDTVTVRIQLPGGTP